MSFLHQVDSQMLGPQTEPNLKNYQFYPYEHSFKILRDLGEIFAIKAGQPKSILFYLSPSLKGFGKKWPDILFQKPLLIAAAAAFGFILSVFRQIGNQRWSHSEILHFL